MFHGALIAVLHIGMTYPTPRVARLKAKPCGADVARDPNKVTTLQSGSTLTVQWLETVEHPGHYRIAFDDDGQDFVQPPTANDSTEGSDPMVLKDLIPDVQGSFPTGGRPYQFSVTLPDIECTNCTLQLFQMMTDKPPYATDGSTADNDIYYQCADLVLSRSAPPPVDAGVVPDDDAGTGGGGGGNTGGGGGGCSTTQPTRAPLGLAIVALGVARSRSRRRTRR